MRKLLIFSAALLLILLGVWGTIVFMLDEERLKALAVEQVEQRTGRSLILGGPLELKLFPRIELVAEDVTLQGPPGFEGPPLFTADAFRMSVALWPLIRGEVETGALALEDAEIQLYTDRSGRSTLDGLSQAAASPAESGDSPSSSNEDRPALSVEAVRLSNVRLVVTDRRSDTVQRFLLERFELDTFRFDTPVPFRFRGEVGDPATLEEIELVGTIYVPSGEGPIDLTGIEFSARSGALALGLGGDVRIETGRELRASLMNGVVLLGDQQLDVSGSWHGLPRPRVSAEVRGDALDVDALLATLPAASAEPVPDSAPSPLLVLRDLDAEASLQFGSMQIGGLPLVDVEAMMVAEEGVATLDPLQARLNGGAISALARLDLNTEPPQIEVTPRFDLDSLSDALAPWGLGRFLTGAGSLELALTGRGLTPDALLASLDGEGRYDFRDGTLQGLNLDGMVNALVARDLAAAARDGLGGSTSFREFSGPLRIEDGVVDLSGLTLLTERLGVGGEVQLGLADLSLSGQLRLAGERLQRVPLQLGGTLMAPRLTPDVGAAVRDQAERRVLDFLQRRLQNDEDEDMDGEDGSGSGSAANGGANGGAGLL
jgi:AsmA protein